MVKHERLGDRKFPHGVGVNHGKSYYDLFIVLA